MQQSAFDPVRSRKAVYSLTHPQDYMILSGGLGSSAYIQSKLSTAFVGSRDQPNLQILVSEEP